MYESEGRREREKDFKELAHEFEGLVSLKSLGQAVRLEIQVRVDIAVLSPIFSGQVRQKGNSCRVSVLQY